MTQRYILMGDIIRSRAYEAVKLRREFLQLIDSCNETLRHGILSPYTVTLGDEFQGVASSLGDIIDAIFHMEEISLSHGFSFKIRYVAVYGHIDTPINRLEAYTMMGPGLTKARDILTDKGKNKRRFRFVLDDAYLENQLNRLFSVLAGLVERWHAQDAALVLDMLHNNSNKEVGTIHAKNRSQIWKRRKHLLIEEYRSLKESIAEMAQNEQANE
uniref:SatD family (SatD) n=1 Tax=Candidatus Kentrum sp. TUN TaxID=2126343 RepID=A0A450ZRT4_9GAMM|nr:MAG: SatD family (SatD) [Candidatus Kentron sp. TUN]VFK62877.1 MAG: SatD family (SatD) [Candidatus Kentron sp. TUN]